jgi:TatD DNase family protein
VRLIDTHCHINFPDAFPNVESTLREAAEAGVDRVIAIGCDLESSERAVELAHRFNAVYAVVGCHPNYAQHFEPEHLTRYEAFLRLEKVVALGEIGLDHHWDFATKDQQRRALFDQLDLARSLGCPAVFHCREAYADLLDILEESPLPKMLFHCFSGAAEDAARLQALGAFIGVDGPITYKKSAELRQIVQSYSRDRVLIETDSPYLSPEPYRGKPNRPAWVALVNGALASVWGMDPATAASITTDNAEKFFGLS